MCSQNQLKAPVLFDTQQEQLYYEATSTMSSKDSDSDPTTFDPPQVADFISDVLTNSLIDIQSNSGTKTPSTKKTITDLIADRAQACQDKKPVQSFIYSQVALKINEGVPDGTFTFTPPAPLTISTAKSPADYKRLAKSGLSALKQGGSGSEEAKVVPPRTSARLTQRGQIQRAIETLESNDPSWNKRTKIAGAITSKMLELKQHLKTSDTSTRACKLEAIHGFLKNKGSSGRHKEATRLVVYLGLFEAIRIKHTITTEELDSQTYGPSQDTFIPSGTTNLPFWTNYINELDDYKP